MELFERPKEGEKALLIQCDFLISKYQENSSLSELRELALSAGAEVVSEVSVKRRSPDAKYYIGSGKLDEIVSSVSSGEVDLVLFNHQLSPSQERNIEQKLECRVLDRTGLILDIFAQRAQTFEGKLQVELAQLQYMSTRLVMDRFTWHNR
jgi:GTP-binding protein HflX